MLLRGQFCFDTEAHRYTVGGIEIPGLHAVLRAGGEEPSEGEQPWMRPEYRIRGKAVHAAALRHDLDDDWALPVEWCGYMTAYLAILSALQPKWRMLEHPKVDRRRRFASILDRVGDVRGREVVFEIKTGSPAPFHGPQLAGLDLLLGGPRGVRRRIAGYLAADGTPKVREYDDPGDYVRFEAALAAYWRQAA